MLEPFFWKHATLVSACFSHLAFHIQQGSWWVPVFFLQQVQLFVHHSGNEGKAQAQKMRWESDMKTLLLESARCLRLDAFATLAGPVTWNGVANSVNRWSLPQFGKGLFSAWDRRGQRLRSWQVFSDVFSCFLDVFTFAAIITIVMQKVLHAVSHLHQSAAVYWITVCSRPASIGTSFNVGQRAVGHMAAVLTGSWCNFRTDSFKSK